MKVAKPKTESYFNYWEGDCDEFNINEKDLIR